MVGNIWSDQLKLMLKVMRSLLTFSHLVKRVNLRTILRCPLFQVLNFENGNSSSLELSPAAAIWSMPLCLYCLLRQKRSVKFNRPQLQHILVAVNAKILNTHSWTHFYIIAYRTDMGALVIFQLLVSGIFLGTKSHSFFRRIALCCIAWWISFT